MSNRHSVLYDIVPGLEQKLETYTRVQQYAQRRAILRREYQAEFDVTEQDLLFLEALEHLRASGSIRLQTTTGETTESHHILEGHRWLRDLLNVDPNRLCALALLRRPRIDGESRQRVARRRYWEVTPAGRDLVNVEVVGEERGDIGEGLTHSLGVWLYTELVRAGHAAGHDDIIPNRYWRYNETIYDLCVQRRSERTQEPIAVVEVETGTLDTTHLTNDCYKLSYMPGQSIWVTATRSQAVDLITLLNQHGFLSLQPQHADLSTHALSEINRRIRLANSPIQQPGPTPACTHVFTVDNLLSQLQNAVPWLLTSSPEAITGEKVTSVVPEPYEHE